jgi:hypothetical protein
MFLSQFTFVDAHVKLIAIFNHLHKWGLGCIFAATALPCFSVFFLLLLSLLIGPIDYNSKSHFKNTLYKN